MPPTTPRISFISSVFSIFSGSSSTFPLRRPVSPGTVRWITLGAIGMGLLSSLASRGMAEETSPAPSDRSVEQPTSAKDISLSAAPDFSALGLDGKTYTLRELLKNGPVLVDFWTTNCKPCMIELPRLQEVWERYKDRGFTLLGVVSDDQKSVSKAKPTIRSKGFRFPNVLDSDHRIASLYNVRNYPTSVLISPEGKMVAYVLGFKQGFEKEVDQRVKALLEAGAPLK